MTMSLDTRVKLHNGVEMPLLGLGTFRIQDGADVQQAVHWALELGYRSIDTATTYGNERGVGTAVRESVLPREEIFVTTKVRNDDQGYDNTLAAFETSLQKLGLDYVDLYLVHWPVTDKYRDTWRALETIYHDGRARAIGVSNFLVHHLDDLLRHADVVPMVNQVECHPYLQQPYLHEYCRSQGIQSEAWSPLMKGQVRNMPELAELGEKYGKGAAQVTLRWILQHGVVAIPKSDKRHHIAANADIFDFELSNDDLARIDALDRGKRIGPHPDNF